MSISRCAIFAIGDIVGQPMLAHKAVHEAHLLAAEVITDELQGNKELAAAAFNARVIPSAAIEMCADAIDIRKTVHPPPTLGESIGMAAEVVHRSCTDLAPAKKQAAVTHKKARTGIGSGLFLSALGDSTGVSAQASTCSGPSSLIFPSFT